MLIFFFFQAEDGIRDIGVTGVQTCALPIYTYIIINLALLVVALKVLGLKFMMKTIFAIFTLYFMLMIAQDIIPKQPNGLSVKLLGEGQDFMSMVIGCVITGVALATVFLHNGSTGGKIGRA